MSHNIGIEPLNWLRTCWICHIHYFIILNLVIDEITKLFY